MKPSIQERMERQIEMTTSFNTLFDIVVTTTETSFSQTATQPADNQYNVTTADLNVQTICNDNAYNTVTVYIITTGEDAAQIGSLQININGDVDESFHNIPRALRRIINDYVNDIYDAIDSWIDGSTNGEE